MRSSSLFIHNKPSVDVFDGHGMEGEGETHRPPQSHRLTVEPFIECPTALRSEELDRWNE